MADAQDIYRRFCATPLRLRKKAARSPVASPSTDSDGSRADALHPQMATPSRANHNHSTAFSPSAFVTPRKAIHTQAEVKRLEGRIESACHVRDDEGTERGMFQTPPARKAAVVVVVEKPQPQQQRRSTRSSKATVAPSPAKTAQMASVVVPKKQKRVMRSVAVVNSNTGGVYVDTPTKAMAPPKRSRKSTRQVSATQDEPAQHQEVSENGGDLTKADSEVEKVDKEDATKVPVSISRNMKDAFADIDEVVLGPVAMEPPKSTRKMAAALRRTKTNKFQAYLAESALKTFAFEATDGTAHSNVEKVSQESITMDHVSITRNIMNDFAEDDEVLPNPVVTEKPKKKSVSRRQTAPRLTTKRRKAPANANNAGESVVMNVTVEAIDDVVPNNAAEADKENLALDPSSTSRNILDEFISVDETLPDPAGVKKSMDRKQKATSRRQAAPRRAKMKKAPANSDESVMTNLALEAAHDAGQRNGEEVDNENTTMETQSISRNIMDDFADIEEALPEPVVIEKPAKAKKKAAPRQSRKKKAPALSTNPTVENLAVEATDAAVQSNAEEADQQNGTMEVVPISRNIVGDFVDTDEELPGPAPSEKPRTTKKKETPYRQTAPRRTKSKKAQALTADSVVENIAFKTTDELAHSNVKETSAEIITIDPVSISTNVMDDFADIDETLRDPVVIERPTNAKKAASSRQTAPSQTKTKKTPVSSVKRAMDPQEPTRRSRRLHDKTDPLVEVEVPVAVEHTKSTEESNIVDEVKVVGDASSLIMEVTAVEDINVVSEAMEMDTIEPLEITPPSPPLPVIDVIEAFCKPLLETGTTSGALFALWFNALAPEVEICTGEEVDTLVEILHDFFGACLSIGRTEAMARARLEGEDNSDNDDAIVGSLSKKTKRKAVRFRHFDLSSLNLRYNEDRTVAGFVDGLIREYVGVVGHITKLWDRRLHHDQASTVAHIIDVLLDTDRLAERTTGDNLVSSAFRSMSEFEHDEVRASQTFFSDEFAKLLSGASTQPTFMEVVFSSLIQSLARFRLRELFLPFDPKALLDDGDRLHIATYEHQDFGSAVHRALKEVYLFASLATPILVVLETHRDPRNDAVKNAIQALDIDDLVHVERFMLACRYLRLSFGVCVLLDRDEDEETAQLCERLEQLCTLVKRLGFEDEAHLFPLVSLDEFVRELESREPLFVALEKMLETVGLPHYDAEAPCVECNEIVTRAQQAEAISCCSCSGRFHLGCLGLPLSFAQFAGNYTCPFCYLGRAR